MVGIYCLIWISVGLTYQNIDSVIVDRCIDVVGYQWYWSCSGVSLTLLQLLFDVGDVDLLETNNTLHFSWMESVRLTISAVDVIHSFSLPCFGLKCDGIPGRVNTIGLVLSVPGVYYGQCSELCGSLHAYMPVRLSITSACPP
jgi:heme/copper-type cytochrome/quinol oxidase subunit 2